MNERFSSDQRLRDMCADYAAAWRGLENWRDGSHPGREKYVAEYEELIARLEDEIELQVGRNSARGSSKV
jgi:hypothetical protein